MTMPTLEKFKEALIPPSPTAGSRITICKTKDGQVRVMGPRGRGTPYTRELMPYPVEIIAWVIKSIDDGIFIELTEKISADCGDVTTYEYVDLNEIPLIKH